MDREEEQTELVVFADDWGRHPSSAQHLVRHLLPRHATLWVNTVGTRKPRWGDLRRIGGVLRQWAGAKPGSPNAAETPANLRVIAPRMYPGFRAAWQRRLNARLVSRAVNEALKPGDPARDASLATRDCSPGSPGFSRGKEVPPAGSPGFSRKEAGSPGFRRVAVTTLPITADLVGRIDGIDRWVYYCVDDFSVWPGLDGGVMQAMERELVAKADTVVCVSEVLRERVRAMGADAALLTHGVEVDAWAKPQPVRFAPWQRLDRPTITFWGLIDARLDRDWCLQLIQRSTGSLMLAGPVSEDAKQVRALSKTYLAGPVPHDDLPAIAERSDVLVMPYRDLPVTRAMQPLKLLEYLATYKPVVVRDLPATRAWADCCDVVSTADDFVRVCLERAKAGLPAEQRAARERRLPGESWSEKARQFERILLGSR